VIGLTRSAALAGAAVGIKVNLIAPAAVTRMAGGQGAQEMTSDEVAPMVAYLAHESCPVSGEIYTAGAGRFARIFLASTPGWVHDGPGATIEDVASHWSSINSESGYTVPGDVMEWSASFLDHL
jgi:NAD(P)-dependent dehydrogenase (short-subunit alcohol dehydrogenase family)